MASTDEEQMLLTCEVCDIPFTRVKILEQHMKGKKHKKQIEDQKRQKQVNSLGGDSMEEMKDSDIQDYTCSECDVTFNGSDPYTQHLKSKQHAKVLRRKNAEDETALLEATESDSELPEDDTDLKELLEKISPKYYGSCSICEKRFNGPESYSKHMKSKSHASRKSQLHLLEKVKVMLSMCEDSDTEETYEDSEKQKRSGDAEVLKKLKCKVCQKEFSTVFSFAQHSTSRSHTKTEKRNKLLDELKAIKTEQEDNFSSSSSEYEESFEELTCHVCMMVFSGPENLKAHIESKRHQKALELMKNLAKKKKSSKDDKRAEVKLQEKADAVKPITEKEDDSFVKSESTCEGLKEEEMWATTTV